jgi:hypothetical protein
MSAVWEFMAGTVHVNEPLFSTEVVIAFHEAPLSVE